MLRCSKCNWSHNQHDGTTVEDVENHINDQLVECDGVISQVLVKTGQNITVSALRNVTDQYIVPNTDLPFKKCLVQLIVTKYDAYFLIEEVQ